MPTFQTPHPVRVSVELDLGIVRFLADERQDTVVEVQPVDPSRGADVRIAEQTRVSYANSALTVKAPKQRPIFGKGGSIAITVLLPVDSTLDTDSTWADVSAQGRLGDCRIKTSTGSIHLDEAGPLWLTTGSGDIMVDQAHGHTEATTGSGRLRFLTIDGSAVLRNSSGSTTVGEISDDLTANGANGDIAVERADGSVSAKTAHGALRIGSVARGSVTLESATGSIEIGVREGSSAWLDVSSSHGRVHNGLADSGPPDAGEDRVEIRARTRYGQIDIRRSRRRP